MRRLGRGLFDFRGLGAFKQKLRPQRWQTMWLGFDQDRWPVAAMFDVLAAFAGGSLWRFALRTALRAPPLLLHCFALLLLPWTLLLALAPAAWFPHPAVQLLWVGFDLALVCGYLLLAARWRTWLGGAMAALLSLDAVLTAGQVTMHAWPAVTSAAARVVFLLAALGPAVAAAILWGGVRRRLLPGGPAPLFRRRTDGPA
jgi:phosphatidylglycerol lysyltransferase